MGVGEAIKKSGGGVLVISTTNSLIHALAPKGQYTHLAAAALNEPADASDISETVEGHKAKRFLGILLSLKADTCPGQGPGSMAMDGSSPRPDYRGVSWRFPASKSAPLVKIVAKGSRPGPVAMDSHGNYVVTWSSYGQGGSGWEVYARLFDSRGNPQGSAFRVNTTTAGAQNVFHGGYGFSRRFRGHLGFQRPRRFLAGRHHGLLLLVQSMSAARIKGCPQ